jgi:hypothetical protein
LDTDSYSSAGGGGDPSIAGQGHVQPTPIEENTSAKEKTKSLTSTLNMINALYPSPSPAATAAIAEAAEPILPSFSLASSTHTRYDHDHGHGHGHRYSNTKDDTATTDQEPWLQSSSSSTSDDQSFPFQQHHQRPNTASLLASAAAATTRIALAAIKSDPVVATAATAAGAGAARSTSSERTTPAVGPRAGNHLRPDRILPLDHVRHAGKLSHITHAGNTTSESQTYYVGVEPSSSFSTCRSPSASGGGRTSSNIRSVVGRPNDINLSASVSRYYDEEDDYDYQSGGRSQDDNDNDEAQSNMTEDETEYGTMWELLQMVNEQQDIIARYREYNFEQTLRNKQLSFDLKASQEEVVTTKHMLAEAVEALEAQRGLLYGERWLDS